LQTAVAHCGESPRSCGVGHVAAVQHCWQLKTCGLSVGQHRWFAAHRDRQTPPLAVSTQSSQFAKVQLLQVAPFAPQRNWLWSS
jgi:hypothetical protein